MTKELFDTLWAKNWPNSLPISHLFRHNYPERWFRIHSLPKSKRYPDNNEEWNILLHRQNSAITEILGDGSSVLLVTGEYHHDDFIELHPYDSVDSIKRFSFTRLDDIDLHVFRPDEYEKGQIYRPLFCQTYWLDNRFNDILKDIAEDLVRVFFLSIEKKVAVAPYDGGVDFILEDQISRDESKVKFSDWLSTRRWNCYRIFYSARRDQPGA